MSDKKYYTREDDEFYTPTRMQLAGYGRHMYDNPNFVYDTSQKQRPYHMASSSDSSNGTSRLSKRQKSHYFLAGVILFVVLLVVAAIGVGVYFSMNQSTQGNLDTSASRLETHSGNQPPDAKLTVRAGDKTWENQMADTQSIRFKEVAKEFEKELDSVFLASPVKDVYNFSMVSGLSSGSVIAKVEVFFKTETVEMTVSQKQQVANYKANPQTFQVVVKEAFAERAKERARNNINTGPTFDSSSVETVVVTTTTTTTMTTTPTTTPQAATTQAATTQAATTQAATTQAATTQAATEAATTQTATTQAATTQAATTQAATTQAATTQAATTQAATEAATTQAATTQAATTQAATTQAATEAATTQAATTQAATTQAATTQAATTQAATTQAATTQAATEAATTQAATTQAATTQAATTQAATEAATTQAATEAATTQAATTQAATTQAATEAATTQAATQAATTQAATQAATTQAATTQAATTQAVTEAATTQAATTQAATTQAATTQAVTEAATTQAATTQAATEAATTQAATQAATTQAATQAATTQAATTQAATEAATTQATTTVQTASTTSNQPDVVTTTQSVVTTTTIAAPTTTPPPEPEVVPDYNASLTVANQQWNNALNDTTSEEFKNMSAKVVAQVDEVMKNSNMSELYNRTEVSSMSQGSVIVIFIIIFNPVPQAEVKPDILVIIKQPTKMKEVFKEGIQRMKEELKNNPDKEPVSDIELDEESLDFEPVYKPSPCESAVMDVASHCKAAYEKFVDMATKEGDYCNPYEFYVSCLKFMVNFFRKDCHVYHVSSAANYFVSQKDPSMAPLTSKCADGNGQVKNINFAPTRADNICLDGNAVNYMAHFNCPDYLDQVHSNETKGDCNILDGLSSCVYEAMKGLAMSNGKKFECSMKDVKNNVVHYKGNILKETKLPEICFKTGEGKQACPSFLELFGFVAESCPEAIDKISTETDVVSRCKHYEYLLGCGVMVLNRMNYNCKRSQLNTMAVENRTFFQANMNGFDVMQCTEGGEVELSTVAPFTYYPSCLNVNEYDYIWRYKCKVKVDKVDKVNGTACSQLTATMGCFMESMGCSYQNVSMILQKYGHLFIAELNFTLCHEFMKQIDGRACLSSTQPQLEGLTRCMVVLSGLSDDMSHDLSCRTYYEAVRCMENLHADPTCNMEAFDKVLPDYATTALIRTPDLLATLKTTSLPAAPKCSDYIKNAVDIKVPCLDKEFLGKVILGRVCRKFLDNVLDKTLPKFSRCQAIVQCVQTAMYESVRASCTVEQVREAINSTLDDLQTVFPLAANSCSGEYPGQCEGIVAKNESNAASAKCFAYMYTMNTTLLTVEENCNLFISALACLRREFLEVNITCTIKQLGSQIFELVPYMASQKLPYLVYDVMQCRAQVAEAVDVATSDHCSNFATIPLYTSTSVCAQYALGSCTALPGLVQCVGLVLQCNDTTAISQTLVSNSNVLIRRLGIDYSKCSPGGGVDSCSSALMRPEGTAAGAKCFAYMFVQNTTLLTLEENCKFFLSGLACVQGELMKVGESCSIRGLAQDYFNYVRLLASQNTTIFPFDFTQCAAIVAKDGDGKIEDLCSNEDIIPLFVSTSYCAMLAYSNDCGVFRGVVNCVQTSLNCSDNSIITNALITNSDVLVRRIGRNYSGCPKEVEGVDSCSSALMRPKGTAAGSKCFAYMFVQNTTLLTLEENCKFFLSGLACVQGELMKVGESCSIRGLAQDYFNYVRLLASQNTTIFPFDFTQCAAIVAKDGDGKIEDLCSNEEIIPLFVSTSYCAMLAYSNDCGVFRGVVNCVQTSLNCSDNSIITNALITNSDVLVRRIGRNYSGCPKEVEGVDSCSSALMRPEGTAAGSKCFAYMFVQNTTLLTLEENCKFFLSGLACVQGELMKVGESCSIRGLAQDYFNYVRLLASQNTTIFPFDFTQCAAIVAKDGDGKIEDLCSNEDIIPLFVSTSYCAMLAYSNDCGVFRGVVNCVQSSLNCSDDSTITNALITNSDVLVRRIGRNYSGCPKEVENNNPCPLQGDENFSFAMDVVAECGAILGKFNASIIPEEHACRIYWGVVNCTMEEMSKKGYTKCDGQIITYLEDYLDTKNKELKDVVPYNFNNCQSNRPTGDVCSNDGTLSHFAGSSLECAPNTVALIRQNNYTCGSLTWLVECVKEVLHKSEMKCPTWKLHNNFYYNSYILQRYNSMLNFNMCDSYSVPPTSPDYYSPCRDYNSIRYSAEEYCMPLVRKLNDTKGSNSCSAYGNLVQCLIYALHRYNCTAMKIHNIAIQNSKIMRDELSEFNPNSCGAPTFTTKSPCLEDNYYGFVMSVMCEADKLKPTEDNCSIPYQLTMCAMNVSSILSTQCTMSNFSAYLQRNKDGFPPAFRPCIDNIQSLIVDRCLLMTNPAFGSAANCLAFSTYGIVGTSTCDETNMLLYATSLRCMKRQVQTNCTIMDINTSLKNYFDVISVGAGNFLSAQATPVITCAESIMTTDISTLPDFCDNVEAIMRILMTFGGSNVSGIFSANNGVIPSCFVLLPAIQSTLQTMVSFVGLPCDTDRMVQLVVNNSDIIREKYPHVDLSNCGKYCPSLLGRGTDPDAPYPAYTSSSSYNSTNYTSSSTVTTNQTYYPFKGQTSYMPSVLRCTSFLYTIFQASAPQETLCRLYTEGLRCMAVKGSIYGDECMIEDFHDALESYLDLANATSMFQVDQCSGSIKKYSSQAALCENPELLATIANVSCMPYYRYTGGGCSILDNVAECVLGLLNTSSIHCCRDVIKNALISRADITAQAFTDFSNCRATPGEMPSTPGWTMNTGPVYPTTSPPLPSSQYSQGISTRGVTDYPWKPTPSYPQPMQPCSMSTLYRWGPYCRHSGFLLARHQADNMTCSIYTDLVNCITLVANYNNFNCSVDDIIMMYQQNSSMFDLTELDHKACTVAPLELRHPEKQSVCADEVVRDYVLKYGCRNFSKENIQYVTPTNFCRKVASTTECIQTMMASFGATCSREEAGRFLKGIPRLEYLGCLDECHKKSEPDYRSSCSIYSPLTQELSLCSDKVSMIRGAGLQDQCSTYWPMLVSCIQKRLYEGGAVCDGNNIVGRLRNSSQLLKEKGLESLYNCNAFSFSTVCEEKNITSMAVDDCNVDLKKCGQEESVTRCVQSQLQNKTYSVYCSLPQLRGNVLLVLGERGHRLCSEGDLRLNGSRIEVRKDGRWEGFCYGEGWTDHAAGLACNQLGYKYGIAGKNYRSSSVPVSTYVNCSGDEEQFGKCDVHKIKEYCQEEAHITCLDDRTHIELTGNRSGWVVAVRGGKVGLICDQGGWYESKASVVCRSLGFASGETFKDGATWPLPHVSAFQTYLNCKGEEKTLDSCQQEGTWEGDLLDISELNQNSYGRCSMYNMATVYCHDEVRLHRRYSNSTGIVIFKNATLSAPVSGEGFDDKAASVVCRQLGFQKGGISLSFNPFNYYFYQVYSFSNMTCNGDEANLMDCEHNGAYLRYSSKPAVVKCTTGKEEVPDMEVKVNADGRVMISRYGIFGTICHKGWTNREAETICSSMGSDAAYARSLYDQGSSVPKWLYNVKCADGDKSLLDCNFSMTPGVDSCSQDAGVFCFNKSDVPSYSLTNGHYGHVMATLKKEKGVVCSSYYWSGSNARVVCRSLGFNSGEIFTGPHAAPETTSAWFSDTVYCNGDEASLDICNDGNWTKQDISGKQNSSNVYYASSCLSNIFSVFCYGEVRLHTSYFNKTGVLQVATNESKESYGTFCADNFTDTAAAVACRELGLANSGIALPAATYGSMYSSIGRGNVTCDGSESSILNCSKPSALYSCSYWNHASILCDDKPEADGYLLKVSRDQYAATYGSMYSSIGRGNVTCDGSESSILNCSKPSALYSCSYWNHASILCDDKPEADAPITETKVAEDGRVLVKKHGYWGTVCGSGWNKTDASVVCRALGYDAGFNKTMYRSSVVPQWLGQVNCTGLEKSLMDCKAVEQDCRTNSMVAGVKCYNSSDLAKYTFRPRAGSSNIGHVMVDYKGMSYPMCDWQYLSYEDAGVLCRYFGFPTGKKLEGQRNQSSFDYAWAADFACSNTDTDPNACAQNWTVESSGLYRRCYNNLVELSCTKGVSLDPDSSSSGPLVVFFGKSSYKVCADNFTNTAADVACREMGFKGGYMISSVEYNHPSYSFGMTDVDCKGSERSIKECSSLKKPEYIYCSSDKNFVSLKCTHGNGPDGSGNTTGQDMAVKLRGINNVVVIQRDNIWFSICGDNWSDNEASVVCRNMGYKEGLASQSYANADMPIWKYRFNCTGSESSLGSCLYWTNPYEQKICSQTAVATCLNKRIGFSIQGGINGKSGWVLAVDGDRSGIICDYDGWSNDDAGQVCRSQGYEWGEKLPAPPMKKPTDSILMTTFRCSGSETNINACSRKQPNETYFFFTSENNTACNSWTAATASCYGKVRLQPFYNSSLGVVLIRDNKESYSICAEGFDDKAANVVCREVGFPNGGRALGYNPFVHRDHTMGFGNVTCTGSEKALGSCVMSDKYMYNCPSGVPAVVKCNTSEDEITDWKIRADQGKVLISRFGVFGEVCSAGFDDVAATIVCKSLGFETGASRNIFSSAEDVPMWIFDMSCSEANTDLKSCKHNTGPHPKDYCNNAAGVFCQNKEDMTIYSIEGGTTKNYGYLVAEYKGTKATVCSPVWSSSSANTVCKQLGYAGGQAYFGPTDKPTIQDVMAANIDCNSHATLLDMCRTGDWEMFKVGNEASANYTCTQGPVKVFCYAELRLHTGLFNKTGIVQLQVNNEWLAVCSDGFDDNAATVVCRQLGLSATGVAEPVAFPGYYSSRYSRGNASCIGTETSFLSCSQEIDQYACLSRRPATVVCRDSSAALMKVIGLGNRGRVIVNKYGINGTVCSSGWDDLDARVYCMEQGFQDGFSSSQYAYRDVPQWISDVGCVSAEKSLLDCAFSTTVDTDTCRKDASVFCFQKEDLATFILTKQPAGEDRVGQVVVSKNGTTQPMCLSHYFSNDDASAVCKSLGQGFVGGQPYYGNLTITGSSDYYWSVTMACSGTEKQADICITHWSLMSDSNRNSTSCRPVHVECFREVRLYPNSLASVGSLVINNDNAWTAVCMDGFTDTSAMVACVEMGYAGGRVMTSSYPASGFSNKFRNVMCTGAEKSLKDCPGEMTKSYAMCNNDREATVSCYKKGNQPDSTSVAPANDCSNFHYVRNMASTCGSQISAIQNETKPSCDQLLEVAECAATNLCYQTGYYKCSVGDIMMTFRYNSNATRDWLGLQDAKDACDGMATPRSMCEDKTALTCLMGKCAVGSEGDFVNLDLPTKCSFLANMSSCVLTSLRNQGQSCSLDDMQPTMTKVVMETTGFDEKQCSGKSTSSPAPTSDGNYCSDVRMYRNFEQKCSDEVAAMQKSPDCVGLSNVAKCLSGAMCENGTHLCGKDEMMLAFRYNGNFTRDWLGLDGAKDKCDGMVHSGVCEDVDILTCQLQACSPRTPEEFALLPLDQKCSVWSSMTSCTLSALSAKGKTCSEDGIRKVTSEIAQTAFKLDLSTCLKP